MIWSADVASACFWIAAVTNLALSIGFVLRVRDVSKGSLSTVHSTLATGQRKDNWLLSGVIWAAILLEQWENIDLLFLVSLPLLVWLLRRAIERFRTLAR